MGLTLGTKAANYANNREAPQMAYAGSALRFSEDSLLILVAAIPSLYDDKHMIV
jgi:hypothetical protein